MRPDYGAKRQNAKKESTANLVDTKAPVPVQVPVSAPAPAPVPVPTSTTTPVPASVPAPSQTPAPRSSYRSKYNPSSKIQLQPQSSSTSSSSLSSQLQLSQSNSITAYCSSLHYYNTQTDKSLYICITFPAPKEHNISFSPNTHERPATPPFSLRRLFRAPRINLDTTDDPRRRIRQRTVVRANIEDAQ